MGGESAKIARDGSDERLGPGRLGRPGGRHADPVGPAASALAGSRAAGSPRRVGFTLGQLGRVASHSTPANGSGFPAALAREQDEASGGTRCERWIARPVGLSAAARRQQPHGAGANPSSAGPQVAVEQSSGGGGAAGRAVRCRSRGTAGSAVSMCLATRRDRDPRVASGVAPPRVWGQPARVCSRRRHSATAGEMTCGGRSGRQMKGRRPHGNNGSSEPR